MKCPECVKEGKKSYVYEEGTITTCMGISTYYDEEGVYHYHNPNTSTTSYHCSNGHNWSENRKSKCSACGKKGL